MVLKVISRLDVIKNYLEDDLKGKLKKRYRKRFKDSLTQQCLDSYSTVS